MKSFIGTKLIKSKPMNLGDYNTLQGWTIPADQDPGTEGYLVEYQDGGKPNHKDYNGYISWSPKDVFEKSYRSTDGLSFGLAIEALKLGKRVARAGWNGKGMWLALGGTPVVLEAEKFWNQHSKAHAIANGGSATVDPYLILKTAQETIQMGWSPSQADVLADDWVILVEGASGHVISKLPQHQQRVIADASELECKLDGLDNLINAGRPDTVTEEQWTLMADYQSAARDYLQTIRQNIDNF